MSFLTASALFTFSSCADDHFDVSQGISGTKTIWENIKENKEISDYAYILQHVPYSIKEKGFTSETYADVLNSDQTFTIWAPENGSYDFNMYKSLIETGTEENLKKVENELIRNNMTRYTHIMNGQESEKLVLFNGKRGILDFANNTFKGQHIVWANIASSNGVLHITQAPATYEQNLYEYIMNVDGASQMQKFLQKYQVEEFDEYSSTPGPTVSGQATWADSVTSTYNVYLGTAIEREDSNYVAIIPTDNAWNSVYEKIKSFYNYRDKYIQDVSARTESGNDTILTGKETKIQGAERDSIVELHVASGILKGMIYNANWQPKQVSITSLKDLAKVDSLETYDGINKFKKTGTLNETNDKRYTFEVDDYVKMFGGNEPIKCSNGYAYLTDAWNFSSSLYAPTLEYSAIRYYDSGDNRTVTTSGKVSFVNKDLDGNKTTATYDYLNVAGSGGDYKVKFRLPDMLSGKYDIYVVALHNFETNKPTMFKAEMTLHTKNDKPTTDSKIINNYQGGVGSYGETLKETKRQNFYTHMVKIDTLSIDPLFLNYDFSTLTDTICIAKDYEIPYCYYGLDEAYPLLTLKCSTVSSDWNGKSEYQYCRELKLVSIILKPKTEEE